MMIQKEIVACPTCGSQYRRPTNLPPTGAEVRCKKCGSLFVIEGDEEAFLTGAMVRLPSGRIIHVSSSADAMEKIRAGVVTDNADVSRNGTEWFPIAGFSSLRGIFESRGKRTTLITTENEEREPKPTVLLGGDREPAATGDQIVTATVPPREMTTLDRRIAPQSEPRPSPEKPSDSLLDAIGAAEPVRPSGKAPAKTETKEEDEEFNKLFESGDEEEKPAKSFRLNLKLVAAVAVIAGGVLLVLLLVKSGGEPQLTAERVEQPSVAEQAPTLPPAESAPSPAPQAQKEMLEVPKSDLVREQEEMMRRKPPREEEADKKPGQKASVTPAPRAPRTDTPKKAASGGAKVLVKKGWALADKGDNDGAIEMFLRAVEIDPSDGEAYYGLGYAYQAKGEKAKAKEYFQKALGARLKASDKADIQSILNNL